MREAHHIEILDCTLRDGAYLIDKTFGDATIKGIVDGLIRAKADYIELGFLQDEGMGIGRTVFRNASDAARFIPADRQTSKFVLFADYSRYSIEYLDEKDTQGIDAIRECFFKHERNDAINVCKTIQQKGYRLFVQPVDILGYSDKELLDFIDTINTLEPYCFSIVDTFGSMYVEDLRRIYELIDHNLLRSIHIGFHSHNNLQMSNALSQEFIRLTAGKRQAIVDSTVFGMGRGAGNTPTELIAQYLNSKHGYAYDIDEILDIINIHIDNLRTRCTWGYSTPYFVAGSFSAHVNNVSYLSDKNTIRARDMRFILNRIGKNNRKRYDYELLENTYLELANSEINDEDAMKELSNVFYGKTVLAIAPGRSVVEYETRIQEYIEKERPLIITVNFVYENIHQDYVYMSNVKRFQIWRDKEAFKRTKKIMTSNFSADDFDENTIVVSFAKLVKCGWDAMDNSMMMLLRLLRNVGVNNIAIAGLDGYSSEGNVNNYISDDMEIASAIVEVNHRNEEIGGMLCEFIDEAAGNVRVEFVTPSRFESAI